MNLNANQFDRNRNPIMNRLLLSIAACAVIMAGVAQPSAAQTIRTLAIHDGQVVVDGRKIAADRLPASLRTEGLDVDFSFTGNTNPVFALEGQYYVLDETGLRNVSDAEGRGTDVTVFFKDGAVPREMTLPGQPPLRNNMASFAMDDGPYDVMRQQYLEELVDRARTLQELSTEMGREGAEHAFDTMVQQARQQTAEVARVAEALPRIEAQSYLQDVHNNDRVLFNQLVHEQRMEMETHVLADQIRNAENEAEHEQKLKQLRSSLNAIFDLKQANRRSEIEQLESRLSALKEQVDERQRMRDRIIDLRLKQLLQQSPNR